MSHACQQDGDEVGKEEVEEEDLDQRPVLLIVKVLDEVDFQPFYLFQALWNLEQNDDLEVVHCWVVDKETHCQEEG